MGIFGGSSNFLDVGNNFEDAQCFDPQSNESRYLDLGHPHTYMSPKGRPSLASKGHGYDLINSTMYVIHILIA